jgi:hypothetical protein
MCIADTSVQQEIDGIVEGAEVGGIFLLIRLVHLFQQPERISRLHKPPSFCSVGVFITQADRRSLQESYGDAWTCTVSAWTFEITIFFGLFLFVS